MGTAIDRQSALIDMSLRGLGVGMVREQFDGFDVEHVRDRVSAAVEFARSGQGPVILEAITYRYRGHSMSDPGKYRTADEVEERKKDDCIANAERALRALGAGDDVFASVDREIEAAVDTPPQTTRAKLRGEFIAAAQEAGRDFTVDWVHLKLNDQAQRTVLCKDPFRSSDERVKRLIASM
jgi:TPP-dependent pyruvate/acetoin dehydrogenase alpha subunit